ncbi:hypothetical protein E4U09_000592 [Claviceps aff. purpurea]|uniref:Protein kinase domain-containing protein n=1 Tax=Claviceps aff. purpurea TaxID=1967640 RepID=A0A9P7QIP7_9HYPO|nr:hypothetical protein E4U09_000592 [Claviceps aff. purpurea]
MFTPQQKNSNVRLLACEPNADTEDSYYRVLVDGRHVKYVITAPGTFCGCDKDDRTFEPVLLGEIFPPFPIRDWNKGHVARDPVTGQVTFIGTEKVLLDEVISGWQTVKFDELEFSRQDRLRHRVYVVTHPRINGGGPVLMKIANWPRELDRIETEIAVYQRICDKGVGPKFLGHVTEGTDGRVIGFITEWLGGARSAEPRDLDDCKKALARLHQLGIKHGDINKYNFLVRKGHEVALIDFEVSRLDCSHDELEEEMNALKDRLESTDPRGGSFVVQE